MKKMIDIATRKPVDKEAAKVVGGGIQYKPPVPRVSNLLYTSCPETFTFGYRFNKKNPDFRGKRFGRFIAIGISTEFRKWIVKCSCGNFEFRSSKALKNYPNNPNREHEFMCQYCKQAKAFSNRYRKHEEWVKMGAPLGNELNQRKEEK